MRGVFAEWQPRYAEHGIATFPVREKKPAVSGYLKIGLPASSQFAVKFPTEDAFGLACRRNRITVLDVDAPDERLLADAMSEVGPSPFVVRSGSGNFQAWYRHNGERRKVRPDPSRPIDILGDGFVVAPPSVGPKGAYEIIAGTLDDLQRLPGMRAQQINSPCPVKVGPVDVGKRNETLWRECMTQARTCQNFSELMERAVMFNEAGFYVPLTYDEVLRVAASAWKKEEAGENWFGRGGRVVSDASEIDDVLHQYPDAFILLTILKRHHWGRSEFFVANAMRETMPCGGWRRERFTAARQRLIDIGKLEMIRPPSKACGAALYRFKGAHN